MYLILPFAAWLGAGGLKFVINSIKAKRLAFDLIGYGGMPSNHTSVIVSMTVYIYLREGSSDAFGLAVAISFLIILDALDLRNKVGLHAKAINKNLKPEDRLRERVGHTKLEILGGCVFGYVVAIIAHFISDNWYI